MKKTHTPPVLAPYGSAAALPLASKVGISKVSFTEPRSGVRRKVVRRHADKR